MVKGRLPLGALRAMQEKKVSQSQVAKKAGLGTFRYWQIENGEGPDITKDERDAVAAALGVKPSEIAWPDGLKVRAS
jgi:transcriptional regulator with XRE-family HTH domain